MRIERIELTAYRTALSPPMETSQGRASWRRGFLLALHDGEGRCGWGEAAPIHWLEGNAERCRRVLARVASASRMQADELRAMLDGGGETDASAACALDTALSDLEARRQRVPLAVRLAEPLHALRAPRAPRVSFLLPQASPRRLAELARRCADRGYRCLKLKVGAAGAAEDEARVAAVRAVFDGSLRLDANGAWDLERAEEACACFAAFGIDCLEDPLPAPARPAGERFEAWVRLAEASEVTLALDAGSEHEPVRTALVRAGAVGVVVVKPSRIGGPGPALQAARCLADRETRCVFTDCVETGIGQRTVLHCAAAAAAACEDDEPAEVGLAGASMLTEPDLPQPWSRAPLDNLRGPAPELEGPGIG